MPVHDAVDRRRHVDLMRRHDASSGAARPGRSEGQPHAPGTGPGNRRTGARRAVVLTNPS